MKLRELEQGRMAWWVTAEPKCEGPICLAVNVQKFDDNDIPVLLMDSQDFGTLEYHSPDSEVRLLTQAEIVAWSRAQIEVPDDIKPSLGRRFYQDGHIAGFQADPWRPDEMCLRLGGDRDYTRGYAAGEKDAGHNLKICTGNIYGSLGEALAEADADGWLHVQSRDSNALYSLHGFLKDMRNVRHVPGSKQGWRYTGAVLVCKLSDYEPIIFTLEGKREVARSWSAAEALREG